MLSEHYKYILKKALEKERGSGGKAFDYQHRQTDTHTRTKSDTHGLTEA